MKDSQSPAQHARMHTAFATGVGLIHVQGASEYSLGRCVPMLFICPYTRQTDVLQNWTVNGGALFHVNGVVYKWGYLQMYLDLD